VLRRQLVVAEFVKVELNANFLRVEDVVQREQIVNGHKRRRVHIAMPSQEGTEVYISLILVELVVQLHHIEILFSMEELVLEIAEQGTKRFSVSIPLWEVVLQVVHACLERFVVHEWQNIGLIDCGLHYVAPDALISIIPEHQAVYQIVQAGVIQSCH